MVQVNWSLIHIEVASLLRDVCDKVLENRDVSETVLRRRAQVLFFFLLRLRDASNGAVVTPRVYFGSQIYSRGLRGPSILNPALGGKSYKRKSRKRKQALIPYLPKLWVSYPGWILICLFFDPPCITMTASFIVQSTSWLS